MPALMCLHAICATAEGRPDPTLLRRDGGRARGGRGASAGTRNGRPSRRSRALFTPRAIVTPQGHAPTLELCYVRRMQRLPFVSLFLVLAACELPSSDSDVTDADAARVMSVTGGSASPTTLAGIWEEAQPRTAKDLVAVARFEFRATYVVAAARCTLTGS